MPPYIVAKRKVEEQISPAEVESYAVIVRPQQEDGEIVYEASFRELGDSLSVIAETPAKAMNRLIKAGSELIMDLRSEGKSVPPANLPEPWEPFSGKLTARITRRLHYRLRTIADEQDVSLNSLVVHLLAEGAERYCLDGQRESHQPKSDLEGAKETRPLSKK